jgi:glycosyltransferase involved in cell wall biosynthesis
MKISFVTANLGSGGAERVISLLANQFCLRGYEVEIIFFRDRLIFYELDERVKVVISGEECHSDAMWRKMLWLRKYVKTTKPDVVVPFRVSVYCTTILSLFGTNTPIVASERIDPHIPDSFWTVLRKFLLPFVKHLVVQTSYIKSYYPKFIQKKTSVIPNPVREEAFENPRMDSRVQSSKRKRADSYDHSGHDFCHNSSKQTSLTDLVAPKIQSSKQNRIISVARLAPQKNQKMMIEAFAKIADEFPNWQLVIFGEGPLRSSLELLVKSLQLEGRVLLPGRTEHVIEELRKSKIFCLSSDYEGMSNSMLEAVCVGLPVISTKVSGSEDLVNDGVDGFLIDMNDVDGMAKAMGKVMSDGQLMNKMSQINKEKAGMYQLDKITIMWERALSV